ncbi:hypothetical protein DSECCO2_355610 [anaerobic digester metagenome]
MTVATFMIFMMLEDLKIFPVSREITSWQMARMVIVALISERVNPRSAETG